MKLLKHILSVVNNLIMVTSSNYLIKHLSLQVILLLKVRFSIGIPRGSVSALTATMLLSNKACFQPSCSVA